MQKVPLFISWSGERSRTIAETFNLILRMTIQNVEPWLAQQNIGKGKSWSPELADALQKANAGIICLTPENKDEPWINFEAGALSKLVNDSRAFTYLYNVSVGDLAQKPLGRFQHTHATEEDTRSCFKTASM